MKVKKTKQIHRGDPVYRDENGKMFVEAGNARVYFSPGMVRKIEARRKKPRDTAIYAGLRR